MLSRIYYAMNPLAESYLDILSNVGTIASNRAMLAGLSNRHWSVEVGKCLASLSNPDALRHLKLIGPSCSTDHDEEDATMFFNLVVSTASQRCWSMAVSELPPENWFGILDDDQAYAGAARMRLQDDYLLIRKVKDILGMVSDLQVDERTRKARSF